MENHKIHVPNHQPDEHRQKTKDKLRSVASLSTHMISWRSLKDGGQSTNRRIRKMPTPQASADAFCKSYAYDVPKKKLKSVITGWWYTYPSEKY